jgi:adenylyltransferase/sulfurtransferase
MRIPFPVSDAIDRYHRQTLLPQIGEQGQHRLTRGRVLIAGCGALGCAQADLLARAGVGLLRLVDRDVVEQTNLQRQTLYAEKDVGHAKAHAAASRLREINSTINIEPHATDLTADNAEALAKDCDAIIDGTDNFETRFLLNDVSAKLGIPYVYGGVIASRGMAATFVPGSTPCLRCIMPEMPPAGATPTCDTAGVLGPAVAIVAAQQAADAMKLLLGRPDLLSNTVLDFDLLANTRRRLHLNEIAGDQTACRCCGQRRFDFLDGAHASSAQMLCGRDAVQVTPSTNDRIELDELARRLSAVGPCRRVGPLLKLQTKQNNKQFALTVFPDGRAIVAGTEDPAEARSVYAKVIGA